MAKRDRLRFLFALLVGACVLLGSASAQTAASGAVSCAVKDPTGAVIENATVVVTSERTGEIRSSTTGPTGVARIGLLPPDAYKIEVTAQGFKTSIVRNVVVNVAEVTTVVAPLEVGGNKMSSSYAKIRPWCKESPPPSVMWLANRLCSRCR